MQQQQSASDEAMSNWLDFPSDGFCDSSPSVPTVPDEAEQQPVARTTAEKTNGGNHSKLRILLFDMDEENGGRSEKGDETEDGGTDETDSGVQKLVRKRGLADDAGVLYSSTVNSCLPTAIVAPTAFSNNLASPVSDEGGSTKPVDEVSRIVNGLVSKNKSSMQQSIKRRRQNPSLQPTENRLTVAVCPDLHISSPSVSCFFIHVYDRTCL